MFRPVSRRSNHEWIRFPLLAIKLVGSLLTLLQGPNDMSNVDLPNLLIEAEDFSEYGGWVLDSQFESVMGSPYLLAHGLGRPVSDATTSFEVGIAGEYQLFVRAKDWVPGHSPGRFQLLINDVAVAKEFGANGEDWNWEVGGSVHLPQGQVTLTLRDLTGFEGRCDAIYFSGDGVVPPNEVDASSRAWRKQQRGLPEAPEDNGNFEVVVVGGGVSGCAAALAAVRQGHSVALIHDRPVLGGNASTEIGLMPRGTQGAVLRELSERKENGDLKAYDILLDEGVAVFLEQRVFAAETKQNKIVSVDTVCSRGGHEYRISGAIFIDTSGVAMLATLTGAKTMFGRESREQFGESYAPDEADHMHHGNTLFFRTRMADEKYDFPEVPWATEVSKDYANLSGQLVRPGLENGPGPRAGENPDMPEFRFGGANDAFPATHFWEYGQWLDPYTSGELVRDYLMRALYGTFSNVKRMEKRAYANLEFDWMAFVAAQGEYRRYCGDYVLTENDITGHTEFDDALIGNDGSFCIHCAWEEGEGKYDFRLKDWIWDNRDGQSYTIPFRCLYSCNIENLMMAGKHISVSHVASSATKLMGNGAQHGVAVALAAHLCLTFEKTPRELYEQHLEALKTLVHKETSCDHDIEHNPPIPQFTPVPG